MRCCSRTRPACSAAAIWPSCPTGWPSRRSNRRPQRLGCSGAERVARRASRAFIGCARTIPNNRPAISPSRKDHPNPRCVGCRLTQIAPDLSQAGNHERWYRIEIAKRRLFYTLARLGLVSVDRPGGARDGPVFQFLEDQPSKPVMTGHHTPSCSPRRKGRQPRTPAPARRSRGPGQPSRADPILWRTAHRC
jgi:hypothetical protein